MFFTEMCEEDQTTPGSKIRAWSLLLLPCCNHLQKLIG